MLVGLLLLSSGGKALAAPVDEQVNEQVNVHRVIAGETLWAIAQNNGVTVRELAAWNGLADPDRLAIGQKLALNAAEPQFQAQGITGNDLELLARTIYAEARGEDFEGQVAVGAVILNRLAHAGFPKTVHGIIYQPGAFTAVADKQIALKPDKTAWLAAQTALEGDDPTGGALFYYNPHTAKDQWIKTRPVLKVIGNHTFSS